MRRLVGLMILATVLGGVFAAGPASAASRGFELQNKSSTDLVLIGAQVIVEAPRCTTCESEAIAMEFEGRPADGSTLKQGSVDDWELKYGFGFHWHVPQYAAELVYKIPGAPDTTVAIWKIYTYDTENESSCEMFGTESVLQKYNCVAQGLNLEFYDRPNERVASEPDPGTVAEFHRLSKKERRAFALDFMTKHSVSPCGGESLTRKEVLDVLPEIVRYVRPGRDPADGSYILPGTPIGEGIGHILGNLGC
jgi:hypothetical protein